MPPLYVLLVVLVMGDSDDLAMRFVIKLLLCAYIFQVVHSESNRNLAHVVYLNMGLLTLHS